jgi:hypothetical protein
MKLGGGFKHATQKSVVSADMDANRVNKSWNHNDTALHMY